MMPAPTPRHALDREDRMCCLDKANCIYFKLLINSVRLKLWFLIVRFKRGKSGGGVEGGGGGGRGRG